MLTIVIIVLSFIAALLGLAHSHAAKPGERSYKGLSRLGLVLVVLATLGMIFSVVKEISVTRETGQFTEREKKRHAVVIEKLKEIEQKLTKNKIYNSRTTDQVDSLRRGFSQQKVADLVPRSFVKQFLTLKVDQKYFNKGYLGFWRFYVSPGYIKPQMVVILPSANGEIAFNMTKGFQYETVHVDGKYHIELINEWGESMKLYSVGDNVLDGFLFAQGAKCVVLGTREFEWDATAENLNR